MSVQCIGIVVSWGLSHGDFTPKGTVPIHREVVSRKALCISGDGVLCVGVAQLVERQCQTIALARLCRSLVRAQPLTHKTSSIAGLRPTARGLNLPARKQRVTRRMVQFLNPWGWLYAHAWGLRLAALTCASLYGAGFLSLLHIHGVGGGFGWNLLYRR